MFKNYDLGNCWASVVVASVISLFLMYVPLCAHVYSKGRMVLSVVLCYFHFNIFLLPKSVSCAMASHRGGPGSTPGLFMCVQWWTKWHQGGSSLSKSVSCANSRSTKCCICLTYHPRLEQFAIYGLTTKGLNLTPPLKETGSSLRFST
jgi:hypothetical protein